MLLPTSLIMSVVIPFVKHTHLTLWLTMGANGGIGGGKNTRKVCETGRFVDVTGVDNHELNR